ncbi:glycosyltransferase family 1 protein [Vibrio ponticus]|uniref:Glycosyltransferase family 1 protein n=1 Tax=Vibrio ponticus TaxID=265668 RepID=A0A3N3DYJ8_9VIBR|nr:glycosyltransferase [Vibrio ponticus]ROV59604.1 glycosyltransferase family 1 protein [Vibrio ponticus]
MKRQHNIIFDPIPFKGGSKIATSEALSLCSNETVRFTVITVNPDYWQQSELAKQHQLNIVTIYTIPWLCEQVQGVFFWLNQLYFSLVLMLQLVVRERADKFIAASGPGVDMPLYLINQLLKRTLVQIIHGNVACSRSIGWCLTQANVVFYLPSTYSSLQTALHRYLSKKLTPADSDTRANEILQSEHFQSFVNGIASHKWPSQSQIGTPKYLWAASLLRWKGLERFVTAIRLAQRHRKITSIICYIRPKQIQLGISQAPITLPNTSWHQDPDNFDRLRSECSIFVSTSKNEPFGLSILEALAAGMCVVIPLDGSYWDQILEDGVNCLKYTTGDEADLARVLLRLDREPQTLQSIQHHAIEVAERYHASDRYRAIIECVSASCDSMTLPAQDSAK